MCDNDRDNGNNETKKLNLIDLPNELLCLIIDQSPELIPCCRVTYSIGVGIYLSSIGGPGSFTKNSYDSECHSIDDYHDFTDFLNILIDTDKAQYVRKLSISFKDPIIKDGFVTYVDINNDSDNAIDDNDIDEIDKDRVSEDCRDIFNGDVFEKDLIQITRLHADLIKTINQFTNIETLLIADVTYDHISSLKLGNVKNLTIAFSNIEDDDDPSEYLNMCLYKPNAILNLQIHLVGIDFDDLMFLSDENIDSLNNSLEIDELDLETVVFRAIPAIPKPYKPGELIKDLNPEDFLDDFLSATRIYQNLDDLMSEIECPIGKLCIISDVYDCSVCVNCAQNHYDSFRIW